MVAAGAILAWLAGCSPSDGQAWHGYFYRDVLSNAPPQISGPYASAGACEAQLGAQLRLAPGTADFACARQCTTESASLGLSRTDAADDKGIIADCAEVRH